MWLSLKSTYHGYYHDAVGHTRNQSNFFHYKAPRETLINAVPKNRFLLIKHKVLVTANLSQEQHEYS